MEISTPNSLLEACKLASLSPDIIASVLTYLPLKDSSKLLVSGYRPLCYLIRANLRCARLNRDRVKPSIFPMDLLRSFSGLNELDLRFRPSYPLQCYPDFHFSAFPSQLGVLRMALPQPLLYQFSDCTVPPTSQQPVFPNLSCLEIRVLLVGVGLRHKVEEEMTRRVGPFLERLNSISSLKVLDSSFDLGVFPFLANSLTDLQIGTVSSSKTPPLLSSIIFPPRLTRLSLRFNYPWKWLQSRLPDSLTCLEVDGMSSGDGFWQSLPPRLIELSVSDEELTPEHASFLPQSLTRLSVHYVSLAPELFSALPRSLLSFESSSASFSSSSSANPIDLSGLPPSLTSFLVSSPIDHTDCWSLLPRSLKHCLIGSGTIELVGADHVIHLPPDLRTISLNSPTPDALREMPNRLVLEALRISGPIEYHNLPSALIDFKNLRQLDISSLFNLKLLANTLTAPLETATFTLSVSQLESFILPATCAKTLKSLSISLYKHITHAEDSIAQDVLPDSQQSHVMTLYPILDASWSSSLPTSLTSLTINDYYLKPSVFAALPPSCVNLFFVVPGHSFSFESLNIIPKTIRTLQISVPCSDDRRPLPPTKLALICKSLPSDIATFRVLFSHLSQCLHLHEEDAADLQTALKPFFKTLPFLQTFEISHVLDPQGKKADLNTPFTQIRSRLEGILR